jgi:16S rRNA (cytosine967-C5)-methyltransferase
LANAARVLHLANVAVVAADGRHAPLGEVPTGASILLDAPCSGLGTLRRRPEIRHRMTRARVGELARLQADLVRAAARSLPEDSSLVYSVCTLTREETLGVAELLLEELVEVEAGFPLEAHPIEGKGPGGFLLPQVHDTDGMYLLVLRRP